MEASDRAGVCHGTREDHCCYVRGVPCIFLEVETVPGRYWACGLRRRLGSWEAVHEDPDYQVEVQAEWDRINEQEGKIVIPNCGEWGPGTNQCCWSEVSNGNAANAARQC